MDSYSKNIQKQISDAQNELQQLASNEEMGAEEKMKKRQELQKQISDLNNRLRQHQIEQRREAMESPKKQKEKDTSMDDMLGGNRKTGRGKAGNQAGGLSQASMKAMISADAAIAQADVQRSVAVTMDGRAGVLKAEIKQDAASGGNTQAKEQELAQVEQASINATAAQMSTLGEANKEIREAVNAAETTENVKNRKEDKAKSSEAGSYAEVSDDGTVTKESQDSALEKTDTGAENNTVTEQPVVRYTPVDIRL